MTYDHRYTDIHRADLDREIDAIRQERLMAAGDTTHVGLVGRARNAIGSALIAIGTALIGRERSGLRTHRA